MKSQFTSEYTFDLIDSGVYPPEQVAAMVRVFCKIKAACEIPSTENEKLECLALVILRSFKNGYSEKIVSAIALQALKNYC